MGEGEGESCSCAPQKPAWSSPRVECPLVHSPQTKAKAMLIHPEPARPTEVSGLGPALSSVERVVGAWNLRPLLQIFLSAAATRTLGFHPHLLPGPPPLA